MGAGASVEEHDVLKASPNLPNRYNEQEDFKRFRGSKQDFYDQTLRIVSNNDVNKKYPGHGPKIEHFAGVECEHMLRKELEWSDRSFYKGMSRRELQQEARVETRAALLKAQRALSNPDAVRKSKSTGSSSTSCPSSPKSAAQPARPVARRSASRVSGWKASSSSSA
eukprot:CAMPEP_0181456400 /NCGR_PEP_ID=MMETSP1110-20121109/31255_1 /TAXON_ID=174948 /ORGANISM="Symbiodinium sp., Strain CCMP421" /LENGTH=166 /DNA_ID=CAMNT_0023580817 /DNA_START=52 /DNA_END=550 /DNA_ORIENTATION=+